MTYRKGKFTVDEAKAIVAALISQGWRVERGKHYKAFARDGVSIVVLSSTPGDRRAVRNAISQLRRAGFIWPPPKGDK